MKHLYLVGFLESGNVTLGKQLAERLQRPFCDMDVFLAVQHGGDLVTFYQEQGIEPFYQAQRKALQTIAMNPTPQVIHVSDHVALRKSDWEIIRKTGTIVYTQHTAERLFWRLRHDPNSPAIADVLGEERRKRIEVMMEERADAYESADFTAVCGNDEVPDLVTEIVAWFSS